MEKRTVVLCALALLAVVVGGLSASAQTEGRLDVSFGTAGLDSLMSTSQRCNYNMASLDGFRIQIYSGSGVSAKSEALAAQAKFQTHFPREKVYVVYNAPFWRVRVGDYRFRSEALELLSKAKVQFPGCYTVRDNTVKKKAFRSAN